MVVHTGTRTVPAQTPPAVHTSAMVAGSPSSQVTPAVGVEVQPSTGSHTSAVHALPSSQLPQLPLPAQTPAVQTSPEVLGSPSSQLAPVPGAWTQPVTGSHESSVQGLPSSQPPGHGRI